MINNPNFSYIDALLSEDFVSKNTEKKLEQIFRERVVTEPHFVLLYARFRKENNEVIIGEQ